MMGWRKSLPVLLVALTLRTNGASAAAATPEGNIVGAAAASPTFNRTMLPGSRRRNTAEKRSAPSGQTLALAAEYLRNRAAGIDPSPQSLAAWEQFYPWCDATIRRFAGTFRSRGVDPDDCAQEVWASLLHSFAEFRLDDAKGRFTSWLYTIVRSKATDRIRLAMRRPASALSPEIAATAVSPNHDPVVICQMHEQRGQLDQALAQLRQRASEQSYRVLHLRCIEGWCVNDVAEELGLTPQQVWVREHRMKRQLRDIIATGSSRLPHADLLPKNGDPRPIRESA